MNKSKIIFLLMALSILGACSTSNTSNNSAFEYALVKNKQHLSYHKDLDACNAAAIRKNVRTVNEINSKNKAHQRITQEEASSIRVVCTKV